MRVVLEKGREAVPVKSKGSVLRFKEEKGDWAEHGSPQDKSNWKLGPQVLFCWWKPAA